MKYKGWKRKIQYNIVKRRKDKDPVKHVQESERNNWTQQVLTTNHPMVITIIVSIGICENNDDTTNNSK